MIGEGLDGSLCISRGKRWGSCRKNTSAGQGVWRQLCRIPNSKTYVQRLVASRVRVTLVQ